jgi:plastocyanin
MMISRRKLTYLSVFLFIMLFLAACGQGTETTNNIGNSAPVAEESSEPETKHEPEASEAKTETDSKSSEESEPSEPSEETVIDEEAVKNEQPSPPDEPTVEESSKEHIVEIIEFAFSPSKLEVHAGDTVVFINKDSVKHSATADDESFDTGLLGQNVKEEVTFKNVGEFSYYCLPHPAMKGTITVIEK